MKKVIAAIAITLLATTAFAQHRGQYHHHGHGGSNGWVVPLILGGIAGAAIANANTPTPAPLPVVIQPQVHPSVTYYTCIVQVYDPVTGTHRNQPMTCVR